MAWNHPPHGAPGPGPFWDFGGTTYQTGHGVDHTGPPEGFGPNFAAGFPFGGPDGFWGGGRGGGGGHWRGPWGRARGGGNRFNPWSWGWGDRGGRCRGGRRCCHDHDSDSDNDNDDGAGGGISADEEMRDAATPRAGGGGGIGEHDPEKEGTPGTLRDSPDGDDGGEHPDPPEEIPSLGRGHRRGGCHRRGGPAGGGGGGCGRGRGFHGRGHGHCHGRGRGHGHHHRGPPPAYNDGAGASPFDFRGLMQAFSNHPFAQQVREQVERARAAAAGRRDEEEEGYGEGGAFDADAETFVPPVDVFDGAGAWTVHVALPGAKKEDVGVSWDAAKSSLAISGVVYRPGDEAFLSGLVAGERKVGLFQRKVKLPPARSAEKEEVDEEGIVARMEDGVLIVVVPKAEKDWTEIKKVDVL